VSLFLLPTIAITMYVIFANTCVNVYEKLRVPTLVLYLFLFYQYIILAISLIYVLGKSLEILSHAGYETLHLMPITVVCFYVAAVWLHKIVVTVRKRNLPSE